MSWQAIARSTTRASAIGAALAVAVLVSGCALQARSDSDPKASMAQCHSYGFAPATSERTEGAFANPLNDKRLRDAIGAQLQSRGMHVAASGEAADCLVHYAIGSRVGVEGGAPRASWGFGWGWGRRGYGGSLAYDVPYDYREGRVSVDLSDARSHDALWHAYVNADVTYLTGEQAEKRIQEVVAAIFARFPVAVGTKM